MAGNSIEVSGSTRKTGWACEWACKRSGFAHRPSLADSAPVYRRAQPTAAARQGAACTGRRERRAAKRRAVRGGIVRSTVVTTSPRTSAEEENMIPASGIAARNKKLTHVVPSQQRPLSDTAQQTSVKVSTQKKNKACRSKASSPPSPAAPSSIQSSPPATSQPTAPSSSSAVSQTALAQCHSLIP